MKTAAMPLDLIQQHRAQVFGKALACNGGAPRTEQTAGHGQAGNAHHDPADGQDEAVSLRDKRVREQSAQHKILLAVEAPIHDDRHQHGDKDLQHDLQSAKDGGGRRPAAIAVQAFSEMSERFLLFLFFDSALPPVSRCPSLTAATMFPFILSGALPFCK